MMKKHLPWWTWVTPLILSLGGTLFSLPFYSQTGGFSLYFPTNLALVMALWWGPRVFVASFLNGLLCFALLNFPHPELYPLYALPETLAVMISYFLIKDHFNVLSPWKTIPQNLVQFFFYGLLIPAVFAAITTQGIYNFLGFTQTPQVLGAILKTTLGLLTGDFLIAIPLFILGTPFLFRRNLSLFSFSQVHDVPWQRLTHKEKFTLVFVLAGCLALGISVPLSDTWYAFGIVLLIYSAWYGLFASLLMNAWLLGISVLLPHVLQLPWAQESTGLATQSTLLTLCFCSLITGSAVTALFDKILILRHTETELKIAKEVAEEASAAKSDFLARMSHEIRTPLNSVLGMLELLRETQLNSEQSRYLSLFSHAGENLKALINDLLDFSKIESKNLTIENVSYDIHSTLQSVFDILQLKAEEKGLHFELQIDPEVPSTQWGDPTRLRQVLFNLIGNALKFTHEGAVIIHLSVTKDPREELLIEVQDTGIGIAREKQGDLFSPFYQVDATSTRKYGGTGLGLVISKNLIEIMGGTLEMKSLLGRGTLFRVFLPHRPDLKPKADSTPPAQYAWNLHPPQKPYRLLLVDDSEDNRVLIIHYLKNLPFECIEATNGKEAVDKFMKESFDFVFMDIQMPLMNGYKATEMIRYFEKENNKTPTPVIALTATTVLEDLKKSLVSGCDDYVIKPVKKVEILDVLSRYIGKSTSSTTARSDIHPQNYSLF